MKKVMLLCLIAVVFVLAPSVQAKDVNHFVSKVDNDINLEDNYNSSVAAAGDTLNMNGTVHGISINAANNVTIDGTIDYGVIAGNLININGTINKDAFIAGNVVTLNSAVKRDTIIAARDVELSGNFDRNVSVYANKITVKNANIKGNLKIYGKNLIIEDKTNIEGTLYYPEDCIYNQDSDVSIQLIEKTKAIQTEDEENYFATLSAKIWSFLGLALVFAAMTLFFPHLFDPINEKYEKFEISEAIEVFTKGLVIIILVPVIALLFIFTMLGIPLGIIMLILYGLALYLTTIFTSYLIGYKVWQKVFNKEAHILLFGLIGLFILLILEIIPGVRILTTIISVLVGLGLIFDTIKK